eukprot:jgi/Ulvmu1/4795/UM020_0080.1
MLPGYSMRATRKRLESLLLALLCAACLSGVNACGEAESACCDTNYCEDADRICESGVCVVARPGEGLCANMGMLGQPCCLRTCAGADLACAEGTCVNINEEPVIDQSGPAPGSPGGACIGDDELCDENDYLELECIDSVCVAQDVVSDQSAVATCGALNQDCCYGDGEELCAAGPCNPGIPGPDPADINLFPCLCSGSLCVRNVEYCPTGAVCDQTAILPGCGGENEPCCNGLDCNEDLMDNKRAFYDLICMSTETAGQEKRVCKRPEEPVLSQSFGCGGLAEKCCSGDTCDGINACNFGVCTSLQDPGSCAQPGDVCCDGSICQGQFLTCDTDEESMFENLCIRCGGEGQPCCMDSEGVACSGSNMECSDGVCIVVPGPCDQIGKACCYNSASEVNYCSSDMDRLTCNLLTEGDSPAQCETCGGATQPCCFPSSTDATVATSYDLATAFPACHSEAQACMLDAGSADYFGMCTDCGQNEGDPCCWTQRSSLESSVQNTTMDVMIPRCPAAGLACQEFLATDELTFQDARNFYRCVPEVPDTLGQPRASPGACGSFGQPCCNTGDLATRCGSGLACNLDSSRCEECGQQDQLCCAPMVPEMNEGVCDPGMGCTNYIREVVDRKCKPCGVKGAPCCWDLQNGYTCHQELRCAGSVGGTLPKEHLCSWPYFDGGIVDRSGGFVDYSLY